MIGQLKAIKTQLGKYVFLALAASYLLPASGASAALCEPARTIEIETQEFQHFRSLSASRKHSVIRARVSCVEKQHVLDGKSQPYEDFWYIGSEFIGCRRQRGFELPSHRDVVIRLTHRNKKAGQDEACAGANAIVRMLLEAQLNDDFLNVAQVPVESFPAIVKGMEKNGFYPVDHPKIDTPVESLIALALSSGTEAGEKMVYFQGK